MSATDLTRKLDEIHELAVRTSQDVTWIRDGMKRGEERMDGHDDRLTAVEKVAAHTTGRSSVIGGLIGSVLSGIGVYLLGHKIT